MSALPKRHVLFCQCVGGEAVDDECLALDAEVRDLKAKLRDRDARLMAASSVAWAIEAPYGVQREYLEAVTDLRNRNWRKARGA